MGETLKFGKKFDREFGKIDKSISEQVVKKLNRLKENPENIGKPLLHTFNNLFSKPETEGFLKFKDVK